MAAAHRFGALVNGRAGLLNQGGIARVHVRLGNCHKGNPPLVQGVQSGAVDVGAIADQPANPAVRGPIRLRLLHERHQVGRLRRLDLHDLERQWDLSRSGTSWRRNALVVEYLCTVTA